MVVQVVNALNKTRPVRKLPDSALHVHPDAWLPELATKRFRWRADKDESGAPVVNGARHKDGLLKLDFKAAPGKVRYHIPCHGRVRKIGKKTEEVFKLIGQTVAVRINTVERCSGHAGTYGVKTAYFDNAMKIGKPVFKAMAKDEPDDISADCALAGHHIAQGMARNALQGADQAANQTAKLAHPLSLIRIAYGLE